MSEKQITHTTYETNGMSEHNEVVELANRHGDVKPKVHFTLLSAIGVQYSVTAPPIAIGTYLSLVIGLGGSPAYFWGFILMGVMQTATCLAVAELASAIPHSSGES